ncbi:MAG: thioredoxin family protein [Vicingaceae bacterium]
MIKEGDTEKIESIFIERAMSYEGYMELSEKLVKEEKTSGENQSLKLIEYTKLNLRRMKRLGKTIQLKDDLLSLLQEKKKKLSFLLLSEVWCGDAAQNLPLFAKMEEQADWLDVKILLRDENLELMDQFLTNGGRSIPKLIAYEPESMDVLGTWGPRPETAQVMVMNFKKIPNGNYEDFVKEVQLWYAKDKTYSQQDELVALLKKWTA